MSTVTRPRGPLPRRVYWIRRGVVIAVAMLLVVGIAQVLGGGSDAKESGTATTVSGQPRTEEPTDSTESTKSPNSGKKQTTKEKKKKHKRAPLPAPDGPCTADDVVITPDTNIARAGGTVAIRLLVTTKVSEACTFEVSPTSVVLKLTSGSDKIWSSQQCPKAVPTLTVVARRTHAGKAVLSWNGHRSDDECSHTAAWALPGYYHAEAAALGGEATDVQFRLWPPVAKTITPKPKVRDPKKKKRD